MATLVRGFNRLDREQIDQQPRLLAPRTLVGRTRDDWPTGDSSMNTNVCSTPYRATGQPLRWRMLYAGLLFALAGCSQPDVLLADGQGARWSEWEGRWILINYWAEWCAPCRVEIPELNRLHHEGADRGVVVLGVNFDGVTGAALDRLIEALNIEFPVLLADPGLRWQQGRPAVLPSTLVIDPEGNLREVLIGPQTLESLGNAVGLSIDH